MADHTRLAKLDSTVSKLQLDFASQSSTLNSLQSTVHTQESTILALKSQMEDIRRQLLHLGQLFNGKRPISEPPPDTSPFSSTKPGNHRTYPPASNTDLDFPFEHQAARVELPKFDGSGLVDAVSDSHDIVDAEVFDLVPDRLETIPPAQLDGVYGLVAAVEVFEEMPAQEITQAVEFAAVHESHGVADNQMQSHETASSELPPACLMSMCMPNAIEFILNEAEADTILLLGTCIVDATDRCNGVRSPSDPLVLVNVYYGGSIGEYFARVAFLYFDPGGRYVSHALLIGLDSRLGHVRHVLHSVGTSSEVSGDSDDEVVLVGEIKTVVEIDVFSNDDVGNDHEVGLNGSVVGDSDGLHVKTESMEHGCSNFGERRIDSDESSGIGGQNRVMCFHSLMPSIGINVCNGAQVHVMCAMEELMPSIGTSVPSPSILAVTLSQAESTLQSIAKLYSEATNSPLSNVNFDNPFDFCDDTILLCKIQMNSISDDGQIWNWLLLVPGTGETQEDSTDLRVVSNNGAVLVTGSRSDSLASVDRIAFEASTLGPSGGQSHSSSTFSQGDVSFKLSFVGPLQLLSSTVTMLAVPTPSLTAILARGGTYPAVAVPLVALGTQSGTIDIVGVSATAIAASFAVHNRTVRGFQWLDNSRLVSFSYTQARGKTGGYVNKLVVTCFDPGGCLGEGILKKKKRVLHKGNLPVEHWLVQWEGLPATAATWADRHKLEQLYQSLNLEDKVVLAGGSNVVNQAQYHSVPPNGSGIVGPQAPRRSKRSRRIAGRLHVDPHLL